MGKKICNPAAEVCIILRKIKLYNNMKYVRDIAEEFTLDQHEVHNIEHP